jgi:hypothetical protein
MIRDATVLALLLLAFAALVTAHFTLVFGLSRRPPRWRALVALIVAPLAPWWGWRERMRARGAVWIAAAAIYVIALALALR